MNTERQVVPLILTEVDTHLLLGSALRYALGRHSYITEAIASIIKANAETLPSGLIINLIHTDLQPYISSLKGSQRSEFDKIDDDIWRELHLFLIKEVTDRGDYNESA